MTLAERQERERRRVHGRTHDITAPPLKTLLGKLVGRDNYQLLDWDTNGNWQPGDVLPCSSLRYAVEIKDGPVIYELVAVASKAPEGSSGCGSIELSVRDSSGGLQQAGRVLTIARESRWAYGDGRIARGVIRKLGLARAYGDALILQDGELGTLRSSLSATCSAISNPEGWVADPDEESAARVDLGPLERPRLSGLAERVSTVQSNTPESPQL